MAANEKFSYTYASLATRWFRDLRCRHPECVSRTVFVGDCAGHFRQRRPLLACHAGADVGRQQNGPLQARAHIPGREVLRGLEFLG